VGLDLSSKDAAAYLGIDLCTLIQWRVMGEVKIPFKIVDKKARYLQEDLDAYKISMEPLSDNNVSVSVV